MITKKINERETMIIKEQEHRKIATGYKPHFALWKTTANLLSGIFFVLCNNLSYEHT